MDGPQTMLPMLAAFQTTDTPEKFDLFLARLADYPRFMAANAELVREGLASGLTAASIVTERVIGQLERLLALPDDQSPVATALSVPGQADRERLVAAIGKYVRPADRIFLEALRGAYREASREEPGLWSAPDGEQLYRTQIRAWTSLDMDAGELHRHRAGRAGGHRGRAARDRPRPRLRRRHEGRAGGPANAGPAPSHLPIDELLDRARGQIERALAAAPGLLRTAAPRPAARFGRSSRTRKRTRPPPTTTRRRSTAAGPASTTSTPTTCPAAATSAWPARASTRRCQATTSRSRSRPSIRASTPSGGWARAWRAWPTSRVGASTPSAWPTRWACTSTRPSGSGCWTGRRTERHDWSSIPAFTPSGGRASGRWHSSCDAGLSDTDAAIETDRYICLPAQALTYKVGQREIERLRARGSRHVSGRPSTCGPSTTRSWATARCRWRRSPKSCPAGSEGGVASSAAPSRCPPSLRAKPQAAQSATRTAAAARRRQRTERPVASHGRSAPGVIAQDLGDGAVAALLGQVDRRRPSSFLRVGSAPRSSSMSTMASSPARAAACNGVQPPCWTAFGDAPWARRRPAMSRCRAATALWSGVTRISFMGHRVAICAAAEQQPGHFEPAEVGRQVQRGEAVAAALVDRVRGRRPAAAARLPTFPTAAASKIPQAVGQLRPLFPPDAPPGCEWPAVCRREYRREPGLVAGRSSWSADIASSAACSSPRRTVSKKAASAGRPTGRDCLPHGRRRGAAAGLAISGAPGQGARSRRARCSAPNQP